jgi:FkbM family methyltransferase
MKIKLVHKIQTFLRLVWQGTLVNIIIRNRSQKRYQEAKKNKKFSVEVKYNSIKLNLYTDSKLCDALMDQNFEIDEQCFLRYYLRKGGIFFDIGSNIGIFSLIGANIVGRKGSVYSFEPTPETYFRLKQNIKLNKAKRIFPFNMALSDKSGLQDFLVSNDGYDAWNSFGKPSAGSVFENIKVRTITFDEFLSQQNIEKIDLIKIDVEGWEINVLNGGKNYFNRLTSAAILIEFGDINLSNAGFTSEELYNRLVSFGYELYTFNCSQQLLTKEFLRPSYPYCNLIALKQCHKDALKLGWK